MEFFKIGEIASKLDVTTRTIRYYEEEGLVKPERSEKGTRKYTKSDVDRLSLVLHMIESGFSLKVVKSMLPKNSEPEVEKVSEVSEMVLEKIERLQSLKENLQILQEM